MSRALQLSDICAVSIPAITGGVAPSVAVAWGTASEGGTGRQRVAHVLHNTVGTFVYLSLASADLDTNQTAGIPPSNAFELGPGVRGEFVLCPGQQLFGITTGAANVRMSVHVYDDISAVAPVV